MKALVQNNQVVRLYKAAQAITVNGVQHPSSIFTHWSDEELRSIGLYLYREVVPNQRYYTTSDYTDEITATEVVRTYTPIPKNVDQLKANMVTAADLYAKNLLDQVTQNYSVAEQLGWDAKALEAELYLLDNTTPVPTLSNEATGSGIAVVDLATKVKAKADAWKPFRDAVIATRAVKTAEVNALITLQEVIAYENHPVVETRYVKHTSTEGVETYGPETESFSREVSKVTDYGWPSMAESDPAFVSITDAL